MVETRSQRKQQGGEQRTTTDESTDNSNDTSHRDNNGSSPSSLSSSVETVKIDNTKNSNSSSSSSNSKGSSQWTALIATIILIVISVVTLPSPFQPPKGEKPTLLHVWYYGWITAISTGLGVLPLIFVPDLDKYWIGISNAVAAGMMIAASYQLILEGYTFSDDHDTYTTELSSGMRTGIGAALGLVFILGTKRFLEGHEEYHVGDLVGADARRAILIFFVMMMHSFAEGVGIGVSFGGSNGHELGVFISASLAVHNVPEGLAIAVVLLPSHEHAKLTAALWAIVTSIPQPIMAVPAYLFVDYFIPILPVGLGFAGGAMSWVALFELLFEAYEDTGNMVTTGLVSTISLSCMLFITGALDDR